jgi:hypothetical protein
MCRQVPATKTAPRPVYRNTVNGRLRDPRCSNNGDRHCSWPRCARSIWLRGARWIWQRPARWMLSARFSESSARFLHGRVFDRNRSRALAPTTMSTTTTAATTKIIEAAKCNFPPRIRCRPPARVLHQSSLEMPQTRTRSGDGRDLGGPGAAAQPKHPSRATVVLRSC